MRRVRRQCEGDSCKHILKTSKVNLRTVIEGSCLLSQSQKGVHIYICRVRLYISMKLSHGRIEYNVFFYEIITQ